MKLLDKRTAQALLTALLFGLVLLFVYAAWRIIIAFLFSIFFANLLEAPVARLEKLLRGSRNAAIAIVYVVFLGAVTLLLALAAPPVVQETQQLMQQSSQLAENVSIKHITQQVGAQHGWSEATTTRIENFIRDHRGEIISETKGSV